MENQFFLNFKGLNTILNFNYEKLITQYIWHKNILRI